jgi:UDP-GlcNAc:undecaprenyl-phosphate GlcNAc-1-phosphate transferase
MRTYFAVLILSALATFALTPVARWLALYLGAIDLPSERKIHRGAMPRLGGLAVVGGFCFPWVAFYVVNNRVTRTFQDYETLFTVLLVGASAMLVLGIYDDLRGVKASTKFVVQLVIALFLYYGGYRITALTNPFGQSLQLSPLLALPVSVLWIVGITNALNLLDGIDGLAAGVTACISLSLALIDILSGNVIVALLTLCLAGACLGFLPFNFSPARIFLGDSGSLFIGVVLACIGMMSFFKAATATFIIVPLFVFGLPLYDTMTVMLGRARRGQPIFQADKSHVHHRLLALGLNHRQAAYFLYTIKVLLGAGAVLFSLQQSVPMLLGGGALVLAVALVIWLAWRITFRRTSFNNK